MRIHGTAVGLALAVAAALAGCGGAHSTSATTPDSVSTRTLAIYTSLPKDGPGALQMASIQLGEQLALRQAGWHVNFTVDGRAERWRVQLLPLDDSAGGVWNPGVTSAGAHAATADRNAVAYIGDFDSGATATSLQITNANDILQVSPWSPYIGFTDVNAADDKGDPGRYQSGGQSTFARLVPSDAVQAQAMVTFMRAHGISRLWVLEDVSDPFDADIAQLVANDAPPAISVVGLQPIDTGANTQEAGYAALVASIKAQRADAVVFGGKPDAGAQALWAELRSKAQDVKLFAPSTLATPAFLAGLGKAAEGTYVETPILQPWQYPARGRRMLAAYRRRFGVAPTPYALYGYDAMRDVLAAIQRAGPRATNHATLLHKFFGLGEIRGAIGDYRITPSGDTTLGSVDFYRVDANDRPVYLERIG